MEQERITSKQLMVFVASAQIGLGIWIAFGSLSKETGHDGWLSILFGSAGMVFFLIMVMLLLRRYDHRTFMEINRLLFGNFVGMTFNLCFLVYQMALAAYEIRVFSELCTVILLPRTPFLVLSCFLLLPTIYLTWHGIEAVCKFSRIVFVLFGITLLLTWLLRRQLHPAFLIPVGAAGLTKILKGVTVSFFMFVGPELVGAIYPAVTDKQNSLKWSLYANAFTTFFYILVYVVCVAAFGENLVKTMKVPLFDLARYFQIVGSERIDLLLVIFWFPLIESALRLFFFSAYQTLNGTFGWRKNGWIYLAFILLILIFNYLPRDLNQLFALSTLLGYWGLGILMLYTFCYLFSFVKKRGLK